MSSPFPLIVSNAVVAIIAGSDTTASVLSNIVYYLLSNTSDYARLREEVDLAFPPLEDVPLDIEKLPGLTFLNAVMYAAALSCMLFLSSSPRFTEQPVQK